jgi:hypothetical protein
MGSKSMAQAVGMNVFFNPCFFSSPLDNFRDRGSRILLAGRMALKYIDTWLWVGIGIIVPE